MAYDYDEKKAEEMAKRFGSNASESDINNVRDNLDKMNRGPLKKVWGKVTRLWEAFKSPDTPASAKAIIIGALLYAVSPLDVIPDVIPVLGLTDDAGVIGLAFTQVMRLVGSLAVGKAIVNVITVFYLSINTLRDYLRKRKLSKLIVGKINECQKNKGYNEINVSLLDENGNKTEEATFKAQEQASDIHEGMVLTA